VRIEEHFQRLLISLGYAAQRMPCLKSLKFGVDEDDHFNLEFQNADEITLEWQSDYEFRPDIRVGKAWGFVSIPRDTVRASSRIDQWQA
jgi:hypothetical protein